LLAVRVRLEEILDPMGADRSAARGEGLAVCDRSGHRRAARDAIEGVSAA